MTVPPTDLAPGDRAWFYPGTAPIDELNTDRLSCTVLKYVRPDLLCVKLLTTGREYCIVKDRIKSRKIKSRRKQPLSPKRPEGKHMSTATKAPTVRELRRSAKSLGVTAWEDMEEADLRKAVAAAETKSAKTASTRTGGGKKTAEKAAKTGTKKTATKAPAKGDAEVPENGNPFKEGTNMFFIAEELIKGGKRSSMVARLKKKIDLTPRDPKKDFDLDYEMDRRVLITGQILRKDYGFEVEKDGRGTDATIKATAP